MTTVFVLSPCDLSGNPLGESRRLTALPIRVGRNGLNDFVVNHGGVSSFHARIEDIDGRLCITDLNSKNGTRLHAPGGIPQPLPPNVPMDLQPSGFEFFLGVHVVVKLTFELLQGQREDRGPGSFTGQVLGNHGVLTDTPSIPPPPPGSPAPHTGFGLSPDRPLGAHRLPLGQPPPLHQPLRTPPPAAPAVAQGLPPPLAPAPVPAFPAGPPAPFSPGGVPPSPVPRPEASPHLPGPPTGFAPAQGFPGAAPPSPVGAQTNVRAATGFLTGLDAEAMALLGLKELAGSLVPGVPLESTGDIARFITKVHDTLDAFCRSFIPLREGHAQFMSSFDLQRSLRRSQQRSLAYMAVEAARSPEALAAALLNPKDKAFDGPRAVEGILADLMLHQLALLEGVMRGVKALLEELSPENVEAQAGAGPLALSRYRTLWNKYREIFDSVSEERQAFSVIFGPEFTAAYRQYRSGDDGQR